MFLVGAADPAEPSLKIWTGALFGGAKVGSLTRVGYTNEKSGSLRLIFTVYKLVGAEILKKCKNLIRVELVILDQQKTFLRQETFLNNFSKKKAIGRSLKIKHMEIS